MDSHGRSIGFPRWGRRGLVALVLLPALLAGCAGVDALAHHGTLDVHTHMSDTVFLDPVPGDERTIYLGVRNTSDCPDIDVRAPLAQALTARGYTIVTDPARAHYLLQANVLYAGKLQQNQEQALLSSGFGQPLLAGTIAGGLTGGLSGNPYAGTGVGLGIAAAAALINDAYQDVTYAVTVDLQLAERPLSGAKVRQTTRTSRAHRNHRAEFAATDATEASSGETDSETTGTSERVQSVDEESDFKKYDIRDVAYADKVNLKLEEAAPSLTQHLASSFANLFE